jgi:hypothetical protein
LEKTAIIATALPEVLREAIKEGDEEAIAEAMEQWQPVIEIPFNQEQVYISRFLRLSLYLFHRRR